MINTNLDGFEKLPQTLPHFCFEAWRRHDKADALNYKVGEVWENLSGAGVIEKIKHIALGLADLGVKAGDRVAIISENRPEWSFVDLAILSLRAVNVPIYTTHSGRFGRENSLHLWQKNFPPRRKRDSNGRAAGKIDFFR
jgi:long-chain acyl-CoA synthetase